MAGKHTVRTDISSLPRDAFTDDLDAQFQRTSLHGHSQSRKEHLTLEESTRKREDTERKLKHYAIEYHRLRGFLQEIADVVTTLPQFDQTDGFLDLDDGFTDEPPIAIEILPALQRKWSERGAYVEFEPRERLPSAKGRHLVMDLTARSLRFTGRASMWLTKRFGYAEDRRVN
jgi:hypothetical protein